MTELTDAIITSTLYPKILHIKDDMLEKYGDSIPNAHHIREKYETRAEHQNPSKKKSTNKAGKEVEVVDKRKYTAIKKKRGSTTFGDTVIEEIQVQMAVSKFVVFGVTFKQATTALAKQYADDCIDVLQNVEIKSEADIKPSILNYLAKSNRQMSVIGVVLEFYNPDCVSELFSSELSAKLTESRSKLYPSSTTLAHFKYSFAHLMYYVCSDLVSQKLWGNKPVISYRYLLAILMSRANNLPIPVTTQFNEFMSKLQLDVNLYLAEQDQKRKLKLEKKDQPKITINDKVVSGDDSTHVVNDDLEESAPDPDIDDNLESDTELNE
jgi:hypothetical protein